MKIPLLLFLSFSVPAFAEKTVTVTATSVETAHRSDDAQAPAKKKALLDGDAGPDLEKVRDSVNEAWDGTVKGVGRIFRGSSTATGTATGTGTSTATSPR